MLANVCVIDIHVFIRKYVEVDFGTRASMRVSEKMHALVRSYT